VCASIAAGLDAEQLSEYDDPNLDVLALSPALGSGVMPDTQLAIAGMAHAMRSHTR
jgi:hypothetical protein